MVTASTFFVCVSAVQQCSFKYFWLLSSLRNRPPQQSDARPAQSSSGYRSDYDQYSQYHQQQMYPGYYSSWGYDQSGYPYNCQLYDYSQYPASQVRRVSVSATRLGFSVMLLFSQWIFLFRRVKTFLMMDLKVCTESGLLIAELTSRRLIIKSGD